VKAAKTATTKAVMGKKTERVDETTSISSNRGTATQRTRTMAKGQAESSKATSDTGMDMTIGLAGVAGLEGLNEMMDTVAEA
jgi:hypothetical protein